MLEVFIFEMEQLLESLEDILLQGEKSKELDEDQINEVFRVMHTIKGSSSMMGYESIAHLAHALEDLFSQFREKNVADPKWDLTFDVVLDATDVFKAELAKIQAGDEPDGESSLLIKRVRDHLAMLMGGGDAPSAAPEAAPAAETAAEEEDVEYDAPFYKAKLTFEKDCMMENLRAFGVVTELQGLCHKVAHIPENLMDDSASTAIVNNGFTLYLQCSENPDVLKNTIDSTMFLQSSSLIPLSDDNEEIPAAIRPKQPVVEEVEVEAEPTAAATANAAVTKERKAAAPETVAKQNFISVNVNKLDKLMDLVGEIVTTESMVTKNPEVVKLQLESFEKSGQQLHKLINEMQDTVMSIRMIPVSTSFHKMQRIVRDMSKKVNKDVQLNIIGEETEVDKNVIDTLSDPLMHLIRNAVDHGLETPQERVAKGKSPTGQLTLEARNTGGDVIILVSDDGKGLNRNAIIRKAIEKGLTTKSEAEISDKEAFSMVFLPGFSTKEKVTEFSGRGVGMDVVRRNIEKIGGSISVDSAPDQGSTFTIRIPLTLAIIEGMKLRVGNLIFIVPMLTIQESFKANMRDVILDPDGNEMIMIRKMTYPILRLHHLFDIPSETENLEEGILVMINTEQSSFCLFVDELIGEQQAVIKPLPPYIQRHNVGMHGIGGCAILGDGSISLIIDINNLVQE